MKLTNFRLTEIHGTDATNYRFVAEVDTISVIEGMVGRFWWKKLVPIGIKKKTIEIYRTYIPSVLGWTDVENGHPVKGTYELEASFTAKHRQKLQYCPLSVEDNLNNPPD